MSSFQTYLDNIKEKTSKTPQDFIALAEQKGFLKPGTKAGEIVAWLKDDFDLGRGHAMAIVTILKGVNAPRLPADERIDKFFSGKKASWRKPYDELLEKLKGFGDDVNIASTDTYISLLKGKKKFGVIYITADRMDVGIKRKGEPFQGRFEEAGAWNSMVTHRVRVTDAAQIDMELIDWLQEAYKKA
jgi:hypothetical protein